MWGKHVSLGARWHQRKLLWCTSNVLSKIIHRSSLGAQTMQSQSTRRLHPGKLADWNVHPTITKKMHCVLSKTNAYIFSTGEAVFKYLRFNMQDDWSWWGPFDEPGTLPWRTGAWGTREHVVPNMMIHYTHNVPKPAGFWFWAGTRCCQHLFLSCDSKQYLSSTPMESTAATWVMGSTYVLEEELLACRNHIPQHACRFQQSRCHTWFVGQPYLLPFE